VIDAGARVVVISTAHGLKFAEQKAAYHLGRLADVGAEYRNLPVEIPPDVTRVQDEIYRHVERLKAA
jgi:threonine synthase